MMNIEKQIIKRMEDYGYTRLDAIASMNLGERSEAAKRASANRARRRELVEYGMDFATACLVVKDSKWFCLKCGELVDGRNVTFEEYHEGCCGRCV